LSISRDFFNLVTYAVYQALAQLFGKDAWKLPPLYGEIAFRELKKKIKLEGEPLQVLKTLAKYFEQSGYIEKISFEESGENELIYTMDGVSIDWAVKKIIQNGGVPPHYSTYIFVSALKDLFNIEVEMTDLEFGEKEGKLFAREKWKLKKRS
jgi:hypothetical protein